MAKCIFVDVEEVNNLDSLDLREMMFLQRELGKAIEKKLNSNEVE
jgi:hypothetical protein